jgi:putative hemolysin
MKTTTAAVALAMLGLSGLALAPVWAQSAPAKKAGAKTVAPAGASAKCVMAGGSANMVTRDLAEFMAKAALGNSIKGMGAKAVGDIKLTCKDGLPVYCLARQKACK